MFRYLIGPELFWLLLYLGALLVSKMNQTPAHAMDNFIDKCYLWIPTISLLVFGLWWIPSVEKNWLLLRVWVIGLIGAHLVLEKTMSAYSVQGPGSGMGYLAGLIFEFIFLVIGSIIIVIKF